MADLMRTLLPLIALMAAGFVDATARTGTIFITRHTERPNGAACLSEEGWHRAANLVNIFNGTEIQPKKMFSFKYYGACQRCWQTLVPVASSIDRNYSIPILAPNFTGDWNDTQTKEKYPQATNAFAAAAMKHALTETGGPVLVAWESVNIQFLLGELGVKNAPVWPWGTIYEYELMYQLTFEQIGDSWTLKHYSSLTQNYSEAVKLVNAGKALGELTEKAADKAGGAFDKAKDKLCGIFGCNRRLRSDNTKLV